jgi:hypothetical protein
VPTLPAIAVSRRQPKFHCYPRYSDLQTVCIGPFGFLRFLTIEVPPNKLLRMIQVVANAKLPVELLRNHPSWRRNRRRTR